MNQKLKILKKIKKNLLQIENMQKEKTEIIQKFEEEKEQFKKLLQELNERISEQETKYSTLIKIIEIKPNNELENFQPKIDSLSNKIDDNEAKTENKIKSIEENNENYKKELQKNNEDMIVRILNNSFTTQLSISNPGILEELKKREKTPFDHLFVASQSSNDIYSILDPSSDKYFCTTNDGNFYIQIDLKESVSITGFRILTFNNCFPKSFDIEIDGKIIKSIQNENELNCANKNVTIYFDQVLCKKFRFIQTGPNWDKNNNFLKIKQIELLYSFI